MKQVESVQLSLRDILKSAYSCVVSRVTRAIGLTALPRLSQGFGSRFVAGMSASRSPESCLPKPDTPEWKGLACWFGAMPALTYAEN